MVKVITKLLWSMTLVLALIATVFGWSISTVEAVSSNSTGTEYWFDGLIQVGTSISYSDGGSHTRLMSFVDKQGNLYPAYCIDKDIKVGEEIPYSVTSSSNLELFYGISVGKSLNKIRGILNKTYPMVDYETVWTNAGFPFFVAVDPGTIIAGTQVAIWRVTNPSSYPSILDNPWDPISMVANYLMSFSGDEITEEEIREMYGDPEINIDDSETNIIEKEGSAVVGPYVVHGNGESTQDRFYDFTFNIPGVTVVDSNDVSLTQIKESEPFFIIVPDSVNSPVNITIFGDIPDTTNVVFLMANEDPERYQPVVVIKPLEVSASITINPVDRTVKDDPEVKDVPEVKVPNTSTVSTVAIKIGGLFVLGLITILIIGITNAIFIRRTYR